MSRPAGRGVRRRPPPSRIHPPAPPKKANPNIFSSDESDNDSSDDIPTIGAKQDGLIDVPIEPEPQEVNWRPRSSSVKSRRIIANRIRRASIKQPRPPPVPVKEWCAYSLFRITDSKALKKLTRRRTRLMNGDEPIMFSWEIKGMIHLGTTDTSHTAFLRVHDKGTRYTVVSAKTFELDDRDAEIMGIFFSDLQEKQRKATAVLPVADEHLPISKKRMLSMMAKDYSLQQQTQIEGFIYLHSLDEKLGEPHFSTGFYQDSVKNMILTLDDGSPIFVFYRVSEDMFSLRHRSPLSLQQAYGMALALINV